MLRRHVPVGSGEPSRFRQTWHRLDGTVSPYVYIAPFFVLFAGFGLFPIGYTVWVSLHDWSLLEPGHTFIGIENYSAVLTDSRFWNALRNTISIWVLSTVPQLLLALWLAQLINRPLKARTVFQVTLLLPNVTSVVAVTVVFSQLFGRDFGLINAVLDGIGVGSIDWQAGSASSHAALAVMIMWRWTGYNTLIYLAAMQSVPNELYESARLDGASSVKQLTKITIPMIKPTVIFTVIMSTIGGLQVFAEPMLFGGVTGGSNRQFQTLTLYLYEEGFRLFEFGYASAIAWIMFLLVVVFSIINYLVLRRTRGDL
jgi:cellobiose transport system permease protein